MKIKITKLDKRYTGNEYFTHKVIPMKQPGWTSIELSDTYRLMRQWCWETFGPSCDYEEYFKLARHRELNQRWCWMNSHKNTGILIKTEEDLNWFVLRWS